MNHSAKIIVTVAIAVAAAMAVPPILSSLAAGGAQAVKISTAGRAQAAMWDFQPMTAEMTAAVRVIKSHV